jgi:GTPase SAR1 family protein
MTRSLTTRNFFEKKCGRPIVFENEELRKLVGEKAVITGIWQIYGQDKNGKTALALMLAEDLSHRYRVRYIAAEQGLGESLRLSSERVGITPGTKILWDNYIELQELVDELKKPKSAEIIFIDNTTHYSDEFVGELRVKYLNKMFPNKLLIILSHEKRNLPSPACAETIKKYAEVIFWVKGLKVFVNSRYSISEQSININEELCAMYWE